jgi:hypothetical protein
MLYQFRNLVAISGCNFLANLSFTRPRVSPIFLTRLYETRIFFLYPLYFNMAISTHQLIVHSIAFSDQVSFFITYYLDQLENTSLKRISNFIDFPQSIVTLNCLLNAKTQAPPYTHQEKLIYRII